MFNGFMKYYLLLYNMLAYVDIADVVVLNANFFFSVDVLQTPKYLIRRTTTSTDGCPYPPEVTYQRDTGLRCTSANGTNDSNRVERPKSVQAFLIDDDIRLF